MNKRKYNFKWIKAAGILILAGLFVLLFTECGSKNETPAEDLLPETVPAPEFAFSEDAGEQQLFCLVTSDLHFTIREVSSVYPLGKHTPALLDAFVSEAADLAPEVVIMCGDNTNSGRTEDSEALVRALAPLHEAGCEVILITGNHDCAFGKEEFWGYVNQLCGVSERDPASFSYTVRLNGYRFLAMDDNSASPDGESGAFGEKTLEWLRGQLAGAEETGERAVFISHHSIMTAGNEELDTYYRINEPELAGLLGRYDVRLAFTGHRHSQEVLQYGTIHEIISGPLMAAPHAYGELRLFERAASYRTVPLAIERYGSRRLKEALAKEEADSAENLNAIVDAVCGKRYSGAEKREIAGLFALFMRSYAEGTIAENREAITGSSCYDDFVEAFRESNYGPWIVYMLETTELPGNRAVIRFD